MSEKRVLLIAGDGTLGMHTAENLLLAGAKVDIVCLDNHASHHENLKFFQMDATMENMAAFLKDNRYNGIVNFLHYPEAEAYLPYHALLCENCDQLIVLSSYRVYADEEHPITESAPQLLDVSNDADFVEKETYAISKAKIERLIRGDQVHKNWTIVRPVISFSHRRMDLFMYSGREIQDAIAQEKPLCLPAFAKNLTAGWDWAGNSGKLIAGLMFQKEALGEAFTVSSAQNLTWGQAAELYHEIAGLSVEWVEEDAYLSKMAVQDDHWIWRYLYDRKFDRLIDNSKILRVTGLTPEDFLPISQGLASEWKQQNG